MASQPQLTVSVIVPVRNEGKCIDPTLSSILAQQARDFELEFLVVDGDSTDGTTDRIRLLIASESRAKLLRNPRRSTPAALNLGLRAAGGEYVAILGAHSIYPPDYIATCLKEMLRHRAVGCSGLLNTVPADDGVQARLVAWTMGSTFASSPSSVRTQKEGYADTIPFPVMRREALLAAGGYDERLVRNQDNDMNQRLRSMGYRLYLTAKTHARYLGRATLGALFQHAFRTGYWNALTLWSNRASLSARHFVPFGFCATLLATAFVGLSNSVALLLAAGITLLHLALGSLASARIFLRERSGLVLPLVILGFHLCYGFGTLVGLLAAPTRPAVAMASSPQHVGPDVH